MIEMFSLGWFDFFPDTKKARRVSGQIKQCDYVNDNRILETNYRVSTTCSNARRAFGRPWL